MAINQDYGFSIKKSSSDFFDWSTFFISVLLVTIGLLSIYSATYDAGQSHFFNNQLKYAFLSYGLLFIIMYIPEKYIYSFSYIIYGFTILLLLLVLVPFIGKTHYGTRGWLEIGGFSLQPSEFAKVGTLLVVARHLSLKGTDIRTLRDFFYVSTLVAIPTLLILIEPDTGGATVMMAMYLGILLWTGFDVFFLFFVLSIPIIIILSFIGLNYYIVSVIVFSIIAFTFKKKIYITILAILFAVGIGYSSPIIIKNLAPHQIDRIETFLNPGNDPRGKGYNVIQSVLAVGSGGLTGKGYMQGLQTQLRYIPKQWTDFIYCVPTEEFGFAGGVLVISLLGGLMFRSIKIAQEIDNKFHSILAAGFASIIFYHSMINIGMAMAVMPVMGIPLPFLSSGGSALLVNVSMVGLLMHAFRNQKLKKRAV
jgi:rod shape determining protein RodA